MLCTVSFNLCVGVHITVMIGISYWFMFLDEVRQAKGSKAFWEVIDYSYFFFKTEVTIDEILHS